MAKHHQSANSYSVPRFGIISVLIILLFLLSCDGDKTYRMEVESMPAIGSVELSSLDSNTDAQLCRKFLRRLTREAPAEPLDGTLVTRFEIIEADDIERWMAVEFSASGATYRIEGQLLSPDIFSPTDQGLYFQGRIAFSSLSYGDGPLDLNNSREAFDLVAPLLQSLGRRVCGMVGLPEAAN
jgi:hypothetical protein